MVTNMPRVAVSQTSSLIRAKRRPGSGVLLAETAVQAHRLGHEKGGVHALARYVAEVETDAPVIEEEKIEKIAGNGPRRMIDSVNGKGLVTGFRQKAALNLGGQLQFPL